jgi:outer membrane protein
MSIRIILLSFILAISTLAQNKLTLEDALNIALERSFGIRSAKFSLESSQKNLEAVKLGLYTSINLEFDLPNYFESLSSQFNPVTGKEEFFDFGNAKVEGRLSLRQPIIFTNGFISLTGSVFGRDQFGTNIAKTRDYFTNFSLALNQPLFTFNNQLANLERAEIRLEKAQRNYSKAELDLIYDVTAAFYLLYESREQVEITKEKVGQTEESFNTANNKYKAGLIAEVEALQLEVDLATSQNELLNAERNYEELLNNFKILIGTELAEDLEIVSDLKFDPVIVNEDAAVESALKNRPDLLNTKDDIYLSQLTVEEVDARRTIKAELNARYGINRNDEKFDNIFSNFLDDRSVTLTVSVPIWDWGQNAHEVESAEANLKLTELQYERLNETIKNEVKTAINRLISAQSRVEVLSKSVLVAEKSYKISLERFKAGTITSFDLSQMQIKLTETRLNSIRALIDYQITLADLKRKTMMEI